MRQKKWLCKDENKRVQEINGCVRKKRRKRREEDETNGCAKKLKKKEEANDCKEGKSN